MRTRSLVASGAAAGALLAAVEILWFVFRLPRTLDAFGGAGYLLATLLPRAVMAGLVAGVLEVALLAGIRRCAVGGSRWRGRPDQWTALIGAGVLAASAMVLITVTLRGSRSRSGPTVPFLIAVIVPAFAWFSYEAMLVLRRVSQWIGDPAQGRRRRVVVAIPLLALTAACYLADRLILVRLYEPLHLAVRLGMFVALQSAMLVLARPAHGFAGASPGRRAAATHALVGFAALAAFGLVAPRGARHDATVNALRLNGALGGTLTTIGERLWSRRKMERASSSFAASTPAIPIESPRAGSEVAAPGASILLITVDALRADHLGGYGYGRPTSPNLDRLVRDSVVFERAYTSAPHTSFALTSLLTGQPAMSLSELGVLEDAPTLADLARANGYRTAAFFTPAIFFVDGDKFAHFDDRSFGFESARRELLPEADSAPTQTDEVLRFLEKEAPERFLIWTHYFAPHEPYVEHPGSDPPFGRAAVDRYDGEIRWTDHAIGRLIDSVRASHPQTIVVVTADHGEEFGEHGGAYHGTTLFDEQVRVPLIVSVPGLPPLRVRAPVSTTSVLPTLIGLTGIPADQAFDSVDLTPWIGRARPSTESQLPPAFAENAGQRMVAWGDDKLLCDTFSDTCALFDPTRDPSERADAATRRPRRVQELRAAMANWLEKHERLHGSSDAWALLGTRNALAANKRAVARRMARLPEARWAGALRDAWRREADLDVKAWLAAAATQLGDDEARAALPELVRALPDRDPELEARAALSRAPFGETTTAAELSTALERVADVNLRCALMRGLAQSPAEIARPALIREYDVIRSRICAAEALATLRDPASVPFILSRLLDEPYKTVQLALVRALAGIGDASAVSILRLLRERTTERDVSQAVDEALQRIDSLDRGA